MKNEDTRIMKEILAEKDGKMTKAEAASIITFFALKNGFETGENGAWGLPAIHSRELNFTYETEMTGETNWEEHRIGQKVKLSASTARMGWQGTPEDLIKTADEIRRGAELVRFLNSLELEWVETF